MSEHFIPCDCGRKIHLPLLVSEVEGRWWFGNNYIVRGEAMCLLEERRSDRGNGDDRCHGAPSPFIVSNGSK